MLDGLTFEGPDLKAHDHRRLKGQLDRVRDLMIDGRWRGLAEIAKLTGDPVASVSAQLRHLRKARFGGYTVNRSYVGDAGFYIYQVLRPQ